MIPNPVIARTPMERASRIVVIDAGMVIAEGTPVQLDVADLGKAIIEQVADGIAGLDGALLGLTGQEVAA
jgi:hypothetical protein